MRELARAAAKGAWRRHVALFQRAMDLKLDANKIAEPLGLTACAVDPLREELGGVPHRAGRPDGTGCRVGGYWGDVTRDSTRPATGDWRTDRRGDISGAFVDVRDGQLHMLVTANAGNVAEPEDRVWTIGFASSRGERRRIALTPLEGPLRESGRVAYWGARLRLDGEPAWLARRDVRWRLTARISRPLGDQTHDGVPDRATFGR